MEMLRNGFEERNQEILPEGSPLLDNQDIFEPKFKHHQEDLKYMFGIDVSDEYELSSPETKRKMLDTAVQYIKEGAPFALDYFVNEGLLTKYDITDEDIAEIKPHALKLIHAIRNTNMRESTKQLFLDTEILTQEEI